VLFKSCSTDHGRGRADYVGRGTSAPFHAPTADGVYVLDVAAATTRVTSLRLEPTRSTQHLRVRFATDHTLKQWLGGSASEPLTPSAVRGGGVAAPA